MNTASSGFVADTRISRQQHALADGRELIYFDDPDTALPPDRAPDLRDLAPRPATASMRQDSLTGDWVSIAAARQDRVFLPPAHLDPLAPSTPGNPSEVPSNYDVVVFENKSPSFGPLLTDAAAPAGLDDLAGIGLGRTRTSVGRCEVVCFSPEHEGSFASLSVTRARTVIEAWAERTHALSQLPGIEQVFPFENRGEEIGVTLRHPHGQIYSYPYVTPRTQRLVDSIESYGTALFADILASEQAGDRVILSGEHWTAFVPFAARWPIEVHMLPHRHVPDFAATTLAERDELAVLYRRLLRGIDAIYETPTPYIAAWHQAPVHLHRDDIRLMLQVTSPRRAEDKLKYLAGSEAAMGAWIGDVLPEQAAATIRAAVERAAAADAAAGASGPGTVGACDLDRDPVESPGSTDSPASLAASVLAGFESRFNRRPDGLWSAPGRVNLIGEHTDYNDGFVFPFAIDRRTVVALGLREDRLVRVASSFADDAIEISLDELIPENLHGWSAYPLGVAWALGRFGADLDAVRGFEVFIDSDVPIGAGLSSSAAIESAVAVALNDAWGLGLDRKTLARVGQLAENRAVGAPTGIMDQSASLLGRTDAGVFLDCRSLESDVIPLGFDAAGLDLLIIDTQVSHSHATGGYSARRASCEAGARLLGVSSLRDLGVGDLARAAELLDDETFRRVRHVVTENQRVLDTVRTLREHGPTQIGGLLDASHVSMRDDFEISVPQLDLAVETARGAGAIGARMTGGGFGGAAIALTPRELVPAVEAAVAAAFAAHGYDAPDLFVVRAADGARREG